MTRKSRRELADSVESMDAPDARPRRWVRQYLETRLTGGWDFEWPDADEDEEADDDQVCILDTGRLRFYVPLEAIHSGEVTGRPLHRVLSPIRTDV